MVTDAALVEPGQVQALEGQVPPESAQPEAQAVSPVESQPVEASTPQPEAEKGVRKPKATPELPWNDLFGQVQNRPEFKGWLDDQMQKTSRRTEARLRVEAGNDERTKEFTVAFAKAHGVDELSKQEQENVAAVFRNNGDWRVLQALGKFANSVLGDLPATVQAEILQEMQENAHRLWDPTFAQEMSRSVHEKVLVAKDQTREAAFEQRVQAEVNKRVQEELKAKELEVIMANQPQPAPQVPRGQEASAGMTFAEIMALPIEEYEKIPVATRDRIADEEMRRRAAG